MHLPLTLTTTAAAALAAVALCAAPAQGATLSFSGGTMTYIAAPGERNSVRVNDGGNDRPDMFAVLDYAPITSYPADRCEELAEGYVRCLTAGTATFRAVLGDGDDGFGLDTFAPPLALDVDGGDGADTLVGAQTAGAVQPATLRGGAGDDRLDGGAGTDRGDGGTGSDTAVATESLVNVP